MGIVSGVPVVLSRPPIAGADARRGGKAFEVFLNARLCEDGGDRRLAFVLCHPTGDFTRHYLLPHLAHHGGACLGLTTRFDNNETELTMEQCVEDLSCAVRFLRERGYEKVVLIGNSGGGSLSCLYQAEAEDPTLKDYPDGTPLDLGDLPRADGIVILSAHASRAETLTEWLDPAIIYEVDPGLRDPDLDLFCKRPLPFDTDWIKFYREAQLARSRRISAYALATLKALRSMPDGPTDRLMLVHGTGADPRFIDITLDTNGRTARPLELARRLNQSHYSMGRVTTMRTWLSQWSVDHSRADGPACLARTSVPVLAVTYEQDEIVFPSHMKRYAEAARGRCTEQVLDGATHFMIGLDDLKDRLAQQIVSWAKEAL